MTACLLRPEFQKAMTGTELRYLLGRIYAAQEEKNGVAPGLLATCWRLGVPILVGAPGVGKTFEMLQEAHRLRKQGVEVVVGVIESHGRAETVALVGDLEQVPKRHIEYRGVVLEEMAQRFGIGARAKDVSRSPQARRQVTVVVDFAVERDDDVAVFIAHRLPAFGPQIDDRQPAMAEAHQAIV